MLSGDMSNLEGATEKSSAQYAELAKKTAAVQSITDEFKNLMISFIPVMTDVIDDVKAWMEGLDEQKIDDIEAQKKLYTQTVQDLERQKKQAGIVQSQLIEKIQKSTAEFGVQ